jgi:hypothetical protein
VTPILHHQVVRLGRGAHADVLAVVDELIAMGHTPEPAAQRSDTPRRMAVPAA